MSAERERIEREATLIVYEFPPDRDPVQSIAALVMRERAAAAAYEREWCARDCALLAARVCGDCEGDSDREQAFRDAEEAIREAFGPDGHISTAPDEDAVSRALAAQERAQAGEGGGD